MDKSQNRIKIVIAATVVFVVVSVVMIILALFNQKDSRQETYLDPATGRTITDPEGKAVEVDGVEGVDVNIIGGDELLDYGVSFDQLTLLKVALTSYTKDIPGRYNEVSVWIDEIQSISKRQNNGKDKLIVPITVKRSFKTKMEVEYFDLRNIQIKIYKENSDAVEFDSGIMPGSSGGLPTS